MEGRSLAWSTCILFSLYEVRERKVCKVVQTLHGRKGIQSERSSCSGKTGVKDVVGLEVYNANTKIKPSTI